MKMKGVVRPVHLRQGLFTVGALDNLDHNPSSTTAKDSFRGTGISLFQFPTKSGKGQSQDGLSTMFFPQTKKYHQLPDKFTTVPAVALQKTTVAVPKPPRDIKSVHGHLDRACEKEKQWLEHAIQLLGQDELIKGDVMAWSATPWGKRNPRRFLFFTVSPDVTQLPRSLERGRSRHGKHGVPTLKSLKPSTTWWHILTQQ